MRRMSDGSSYIGSSKAVTNRLRVETGEDPPHAFRSSPPERKDVTSDATRADAGYPGGECAPCLLPPSAHRRDQKRLCPEIGGYSVRSSTNDFLLILLRGQKGKGLLVTPLVDELIDTICSSSRSVSTRTEWTSVRFGSRRRYPRGSTGENRSIGPSIAPYRANIYSRGRPVPSSEGPRSRLGPRPARARAEGSRARRSDERERGARTGGGAEAVAVRSRWRHRTLHYASAVRQQSQTTVSDALPRLGGERHE